MLDKVWAVGYVKKLLCEVRGQGATKQKMRNKVVSRCHLRARKT